MRWPSILLFVFVCDNIVAQYNSPDSLFSSEKKAGSNKEESSGQPKIVIRCAPTNLNNESLIIIDGILVENEMMNKLDPNDVESISVLKDASATALYGYKASNGVIIITTKASNQKAFIIKDFLDGSLIPGASVSFISKEKRDTLMFVADDSGRVVTDKIKYDGEYKIEVSSVGYKALSTAINRGKSQQLLLERDLKQNSEVIVSSNILISCRRLICCKFWSPAIYTYASNEIIKDEDSYHLYPNPVQRGGTVTINLKNETADLVSIRVLNLMGQPILSQSKQLKKGANNINVRADDRWTAGTYIVQLIDKSGKVLKSDKLIIQ